MGHHYFLCTLNSCGSSCYIGAGCKGSCSGDCGKGCSIACSNVCIGSGCKGTAGCSGLLIYCECSTNDCREKCYNTCESNCGFCAGDCNSTGCGSASSSCSATGRNIFSL